MNPAQATAGRSARPSPGSGCALLFARIARISGHRLSRALDAARISGHEFAILSRLSEGGTIHQQELSRILRVHPSNLVALLDQLEAAGLIARRRDPSDRRRYRVVLTAAGRRRLGQAERAAAEAEEELLAPLSSEERVSLHAYLERIADHGCRPASGGWC